MFSSRVGQGLGRNRIAIAIEQRRAAHLPIVDLTESNPTSVGISYPAGLLRPLSAASARRYEPEPFGLPLARRAVSADFARRGVTIAPERIALTASTSEAYAFLFKLLCDPGDTVLAPRPSYPLVEHLTDLEGVGLEPYTLEFHGRWSVDSDQLREAIAITNAKGKRARAIILISPNNPTGMILQPDEISAVAALAGEHDLALIADEVFADYSLDGRSPASAVGESAALTFGLGGMSKTVGLPQVKLGWIAVSGPNRLVDEALARLETICDAYLSVSTPVQIATPDLLRNGAAVRTQIQDRIRGNFERLRQIARAHPSCSVLPAEGGWYGIVQVPAVKSEETLVLELLARTGILVHPGYFFDFDREAFLVMSLLPDTAVFSAAVETIFNESGRL